MTEKLPTMLRVSEVAEALQISDPHVYKLIAKGEMRSVKMGRSIRVRMVDLHQFIQDNLSEPRRVDDQE